MIGAAAWLAGCAPNLTPAQWRAWDAFQDCRALAPTATIAVLPPQGGVRFKSRDDEREIMSRCLNERHGYSIR